MMEKMTGLLPESVVPVVVLITGFLIITISILLTKLIMKLVGKFKPDNKTDKKSP